MARMLISGASGFIGHNLCAYLREAGHEVHRLVRRPELSAPDCILWNPESGFIEKDRVEGFDAWINLSGYNIASGRWNSNRRHKIWVSRVAGTRLLNNTIYELAKPPQVLLSASAVGYYGDRGHQELTEQDAVGDGFLANVCRTWEDAAAEVEEQGVRRVLLRFGVVLGRDGGSLQLMLPAFRLGLGGPLGRGTQYMSWIALDDVLRAIEFAFEHEDIRGAINVTSPQPVPQARFAKALAHVLGRPGILPMPGWLLQLLLGDLAREVLLASARVQPLKLQAAGFEWQYPEIHAALQHIVEPHHRR